MAKYMFQIAYSLDGIRRLRASSATAIRAGVAKMVEGVGGKIEAYYYAFGSEDIVGIVEVPDNVSAATVSIVANSAGLAQVHVTPLLTVEEIDTALEKGKTLSGPAG